MRNHAHLLQDSASPACAAAASAAHAARAPTRPTQRKAYATLGPTIAVPIYTTKLGLSHASAAARLSAGNIGSNSVNPSWPPTRVRTADRRNVGLAAATIAASNARASSIAAATATAKAGWRQLHGRPMRNQANVGHFGPSSKCSAGAGKREQRRVWRVSSPRGHLEAPIAWRQFVCLLGRPRVQSMACNRSPLRAAPSAGGAQGSFGRMGC